MFTLTEETHSLISDIRYDIDPNVNSGGCGIYASLIGAFFGWDNFIPLSIQSGILRKLDLFVDGNRLTGPPAHIVLLCKYTNARGEVVDSVYDSDGFRAINIYTDVYENTYMFPAYSCAHSVKITWESLLEITYSPAGWNSSFDRSKGTLKIERTITDHLKSKGLHNPYTTAVETFMTQFRTY